LGQRVAILEDLVADLRAELETLKSMRLPQ